MLQCQALILLLVVLKAYHVEAVGEEMVQIPYTENEMKSLITNAKNYIQKMEDSLKDAGIATRTEVKSGAAAEEIIKISDELHCDMVAMSTHGRSGISRWTLGSVADKVLHGGNTPVLLVKQPVINT